MDGEIYSREALEELPNWVGTFRHCISIITEHVVCLMKQPKKGYWWKTPGKPIVTEANLDRLQEAIKAGRMELVDGRMPRGVQKCETNLMKSIKSKEKRPHRFLEQMSKKPQQKKRRKAAVA